MIKQIPITEEESVALLAEATDGKALPLSYGGPQGVVIDIPGDESANWALIRLLEMRHKG